MEWFYHLFIGFAVWISFFRDVLSETGDVKFTCDFEVDQCDMRSTNGGGGATIERRLRRPTDTVVIPRRDNENGQYYIFRDFTNSNFIEREPTISTLEIPLSSPAPHCIRFWMYMRADLKHKASVEAVYKSPNSQQVLEEFAAVNAPTWTWRSINFAPQKSFSIRFKLTILPLSNDKTVGWAADEIEVVEGLCPREVPDEDNISCDFEEGDCGYTVFGDQQQLNWTLGSGSSSNGPNQDSTYHSTEGHYMFVEYMSRPSPPGFTSMLMSPEQVVNEPSCLSYFYRISTDNQWDRIALNVGFGTSTIGHSFAHGDKWVLGTLPITPTGSAESVSFFVVDVAGLSGHVAVDDISLIAGACQISGSCNFGGTAGANEYCGWQAVTDDLSVNMIWMSGKPVTGSTGVLQPNNFIYFTGGRGSGHMARSRAVLYSQELQPSQARCMTFEYFFGLSKVAEIKIYQTNENQEQTLLWQHDGTLGADETVGKYGWSLARVNLTSSSLAPFTVQIEGHIFQEISLTYVVGVDNIEFIGADCTVVPPSAVPRPVVTPPIPASVAVCNFDNDLTIEKCGFIADEENATLLWRKRNGNSPAQTDDEPPVDQQYAPDHDHTTSEIFGNYLYFQSPADVQPGAFAREISPVYTKDKPEERQCLRFWYIYHAKSTTDGEFNVLIRTTDGRESVAWTNRRKESFETYEWALGRLVEPFSSEGFQIIFEAKALKSGGYVSVALDDVTVDSKNCASFLCDFEEGMCNWENRAVGSYYNAPNPDFTPALWEYGNAALLGSEFADRGLFLYTPVSTATPNNAQAMLYHGEIITSSNTKACMTFDYYTPNVSDAYIQVVRVTGSAFGNPEQYVGTPVWTSLKSSQTGWQKGQVFLEDDDEPWTALFIGFANPQNNTYLLSPLSTYVLAVDSIAVTSATTAAQCKNLPATSVVPTTVAPMTSTTRPTTSPGALLLSCNFNEDWCGFQVASGSLWRKTNRKDPSTFADQVPARNTDNPDEFLYIEYDAFVQFSTQGAVITPTIAKGSSVTGHYCMRFWMWMMSDEGLELAVRLRESSGREYDVVVYDAELSDERLWFQHEVSIENQLAFQIMLKATIAPEDQYAYLAIDDLLLEAGKCSEDPMPTPDGSVSCNFEEDDCGYLAKGDTQYLTWTRRNRQSISSQDFLLVYLSPAEDTTYHTADGHFVFAYFGDNTDAIPQNTRKSAVYLSPSYSVKGPQCVSFFHQLNKQKNVANGPTLRVSVEGADDLFVSSEDRDKEWILVRRPVTPRNPNQEFQLQFKFDASGSSRSRGGIAIDDITISPGSCTNPGDCKFGSFSANFCSWKPQPQSVRHMLWVNGLPTIGPPTESGYIYFEGGRTSPNRPRMKAILYSEDIASPHDSLCMSFMYYFNSTGAAVVRIHQVETVTESNPVWEHFGRGAANTSADVNIWKHAKIPLNDFKDDFIIKIEGEIIRETGFRYFMAIDEIQFLNAPCVLTPADSVPLPIVNPPADDEPVEMCTFDDRVPEMPMCDWTPEPNTWKLQRGVDNAFDSIIPPFDHTNLEPFNNYIYYNLTGKPIGTSGSVTTIPYSREKQTDPRCVRFWAQITGEDRGIFTVTSIDENGLTAPTVLVTEEGIIPTKEWMLGSFPETTTNKEFRLKFSYELSYTSDQSGLALGGMAIDDVSVAHEPCHPIECSFAHGSCDWENYYANGIPDQLDWVFGTSDVLPSLDDGIDRGYFMYLPVEADTPTAIAYLRNQGLMPVGGPNCLHFEFLITTRGAGRLSIWLYELDAFGGFEASQVWYSDGDKFGEWTQGQVYIAPQRRWTLMIEGLANPAGVLLAAKLHGIAIDNIRVDDVPDMDHCPNMPVEVIPTLPPTTRIPTTRTTMGITTRANTVRTTTTAQPFPDDANCDFNDASNSFCGWSNEQGNQYKWEIGMGMTTGPFSGPVNGDNSIPQRDGKYVYLNAPNVPQGRKVRLFSPLLPAASSYCMRFFYNMNGQGIENLNVFYVQEGQQFSQSWTAPFSLGGGNFADQWIGASFTLSVAPTKGKTVVIEAIRGSTDASYIGLDDITFTKGRCEAAGDCDFEQHSCNYNHFTTNWLREVPQNLGSTRRSIYAVATVDDQKAPIAVLRSEVLKANINRCFRFNILAIKGSATVRIKRLDYTTAGTVAEYVIWQNVMKYDPNVVAPLSARAGYTSNTRHQISIEISAGNGAGETKIGIDDVSVSTISCATIPTEANPNLSTTVQTTIPTTPVPVPQNPLSTYNCDFETQNYCGWQPLSGKWGIANKRVDSVSGPSSGNGGSKYFAYFATSGVSTVVVGELESPVISYPALVGGDVPNYYSFSFWYYMYGSRIVSLKLNFERPVDGTGMQLIWQKNGDQGDRWHQARVVLPARGSDIKLRFVAQNHYYPESWQQFVTAIDDLVFDDRRIPDEFEENECDFDTESFCGYDRQMDQDGVTWVWRNGITSSQLNDGGPVVDQSQNAPLGNYMAYLPSKVGRSSQLTSTSHPPVDQACLKFYYYKRPQTTEEHPGITELFILQGNSLGEVVWSDEQVITGNFWEPVFVQVSSPSNAWKVVWQATTVAVKQPIVAIDSVTLTAGSCSSEVLSCSFNDDNLCEWKPDLDAVEWQLTSGPSTAFGTGPSGDALGATDGGYLLFKPSETIVGSGPVLISAPTQLKDGYVCFSFWYSMYGTEVGELKVSQKNLDSDQTDVLWLLSGEQGPGWKKGRVFLTNQDPFQILVEAKRLYGLRGNIAVDEFEEAVSGVDCFIQPFEALPNFGTTTIEPTTPGVPTVNCTFEGPWCAWSSEPATVNTWKYVQASSSGSSSAPDKDHTSFTGAGHYMLFEAGRFSENQEASLTVGGEFIIPTASKCLRFYYHAGITFSGKLMVMSVLNNLSTTVLWQRTSPNEGAVWQAAEVQIDDPTSQLDKIQISALRGRATQHGDIAIDDITLTDEECHDGAKFCSFDQGMCGFLPGSGDDKMHWVLSSPTQDVSQYQTPSNDVSTNTPRGSYIMTRKRDSSNFLPKSVIKSPEYAAVQGPECVEFYFWLTADISNADYLTVTMVEDRVETEVMKLVGTHGNRWVLASKTITTNYPYHLVFESYVSDFQTFVAIDAFSITNGTCQVPLDCDFETDSLCRWHNPDDNDVQTAIDWVSVNGRESTGGPLYDKVPGTRDGYYALAEASLVLEQGVKAWLISQTVSSGVYTCFRFWYLKGGDAKNNSPLRVKVRHVLTNMTYPVWTMERGQAGSWVLGQFDTKYDFPHEIIFEMERGAGHYSHVSLDGFNTTHETECTETIPAEASPLYEPTTAITSIPTETPPPSGIGFKCNFDDGNMCGFVNNMDVPEASQDCVWIPHRGEGFHFNTGPRNDHTFGDVNGAYLYMHSAPCVTANSSTGALLTSSTSFGGFTHHRQCLKFWYHMYGAPGALYVFLNTTDGVWQPEWIRMNNQGKQWLSAHVTIDNTERLSYFINFWALVGENKFGDMALDDMEFHEGPCQRTENICDFESSGCQFSSEITPGQSQFKWKRGKMAEIASETGTIDHTSYTYEGHVAYANGTGTRPGMATFMVHPPIERGPAPDQCLTFWYLLLSSSEEYTAMLRVHFMRENTVNYNKPVWEIRNGFPDGWEYAAVPITNLEKYQYAIEARNGDKTRFYLDDIEIKNEKCPEPFSCSFEDGFCGWSNDNIDNTFSWIRFQGEDSELDNVDNAGPSVDHTTNSSLGHYIYIDNEYPSPNRDPFAYLVSPRISGEEEQAWCFSFWLHMYIDSRSDASLTLLKTRSNGTSEEIWSQNHPGRNRWEIVDVTVETGGKDLRLRFEGKVHGAYGKSDIALDDFLLEPGACPDVPVTAFSCAGGVVITTDQVCDQQKDCPQGDDEANCGNCQFQDSKLCGYKIFADGNFTWEQGTTDLYPNVPPPSIGGSFMFADPSKGADRTSTYLDSPYIRETSQSCMMSFDYYIKTFSSGDPGAILVYLQAEDILVTLAIVDTNSDDASLPNFWKRRKVQVGRNSNIFRFVFRARKGYIDNAVIAITNIQFESCGFPAPEPGQCKPQAPWRCDVTQVCIPEEYVCDYSDDCGAREDEANCRLTHPNRCNFDDDMCDWAQDPTQRLDWVRTTTRSSTAYSGPLRDHTTGLKNGGYIYLDSTHGTPTTTDKGRLTGGVMPAISTKNCYLRFHYHMYGKDMGRLNVILKPSSGVSRTLITLSENKGDLWNRHIQQIESPVPYQIIFEGELGGNKSDIALDDISLSSGCFLPAPTTAQTIPTTEVQTTASTLPTTPVTSTAMPTTQASTTTQQTTKPVTTPQTTPPLTTPQTASTPSVATDGTSGGPSTPPACSHWCAPEKLCLLQSQVCDGKPDCTDGFDEKFCGGLRTPPATFGAGTLSGIVIGCLVVMLAGFGAAYYFVKSRAPSTGGNAGSVYRNFGTLDEGKDNDVGLNDFFAKDL